MFELQNDNVALSSRRLEEAKPREGPESGLTGFLFWARAIFSFLEIRHLFFLFSYCNFWAPTMIPFSTSRNDSFFELLHFFFFFELLQLYVLIPKFSRFMLEQNLAKTMLEFQELMTVFQVTIMIMILIWNSQWIWSWFELAKEYVSASALERQPQGNERAAV